MFDVPIVLILFKRKKTALQVIDQIRICEPRRLYLLSDEGRDETERRLVAEVRSAVEAAIDWDCEVVKNYAPSNRGVFENIGQGAKWVFEREESAIFLEDDNIPESTFFEYCRELLNRYADSPEVLWICGTNYLEEFAPSDDASYMFTKHLLPCGWASWAEKFNKYYDESLDSVEDPTVVRLVLNQHENKSLHHQQLRSVQTERQRLLDNRKFVSWDFHMAWTIRTNNLLGISPAQNQIRNVGADAFSEHGGNSLELEMTKRFCGMGSRSLSFPLKHPEQIAIDPNYERRIAKIILLPASARVKAALRRGIGRIFHLSGETSISSTIRRSLSWVVDRDS